MSSGRITSIRADKGFGFIAEGTSTDGKSNDVFFHRSAVVGTEFEYLREGQEVTFRVEADPRDASRFRAADVRLAEDQG